MNIRYITLLLLAVFLFSGYKQGAVKTYKVKINYVITQPGSSKLELQIGDKLINRTLKADFDTSFKAVTGAQFSIKGTCKVPDGNDILTLYYTDSTGNNPQNIILKPSSSNDNTVSLDLVLP